ncbi:response regulator transcription factor [Brevundimonas sp.]|uniref:response regulator transcription factor n=1 Tax=Brevundimonas sp. TaxID=1871086 RepID=UPI002FCBE85F
MHIDTGRRDERHEIATTSLHVGTGRARALLLIGLNDNEHHELGGYLERQGFHVIRVGSTSCLHDDEPQGEKFEAIVLIVRLPDAEALAAIRQLNSSDAPPLLVVALEGETVERVLVLEMGADDLVGRETEPREVLARLHRLIRRRSEPIAPARRAEVHNWALKPSQRKLITPSGHSIKLTARDQALMNAFSDNTDGLLLDWDYPRGHIRTAISRLKRKVMADAGVALPIHNVWGQGYCFSANLVQA